MNKLIYKLVNELANKSANKLINIETKKTLNSNVPTVNFAAHHVKWQPTGFTVLLRQE
ncbi:hypothetical protein GCM10011396_43000 [Undibacterium terreum]|uniref:Uncharacterized protein n=1 Tax=Undibacterium terreum TaxID=1224302 RepID=A0A916UVY3_9BURK|nr:hypothetical protein GCM10011396_43000 [Undibacterium terreum]